MYKRPAEAGRLPFACPGLAPPNLTLPRLAGLAGPQRSAPQRNMPCLPRRISPDHIFPCLACLNTPFHTSTVHTVPCQPYRANSFTQPLQRGPALPPPASQRQDARCSWWTRRREPAPRCSGSARIATPCQPAGNARPCARDRSDW